jgi:quinolinate synthase
LAHLAWSAENLVAGSIVNEIRVDADVAEYSMIALERMLEVK